MKDLTSRQKEVFDFIRNYIDRHSFPPTIREVASYFEVSVRGAYDHVKALEKKGWINGNRNRSRALEIVQSHSSEDIVYIPILGKVAAGIPVMSEENFEGTISVSSELVSRGTLFAVRVEGESMIEAGILDGDLAIIVHQSTANNGDIVIAMLDEAFTIKRFYKEKNRVRLKAENKNFPSLYTRDVQILGKLVTLVRQYG